MLCLLKNYSGGQAAHLRVDVRKGKEESSEREKKGW